MNINNISFIRRTQECLNPNIFEVVEHKGEGHPDALCATIALALANNPPFPMEQKPYYYFDKLYLLPGQTEVYFGGGRILKPPRVCLFTVSRVHLNIESVKNIIKSAISPIAPDFEYEVTIEMVQPSHHSSLTFDTEQGETSEDSTVAVAYYPPSEIEVLSVELDKHILQLSKLDSFKYIGPDRKYILVWSNHKLTIIAAIAFRSPYIMTLQTYLDAKKNVQEVINEFLVSKGFANTIVRINPDDRPSLNSVYLTYSGLSWESSDCGFIGRGNRIHNVISPLRPSPTDAMPGKSWVNHPAAILNTVAMETCKRIHRELSVKSCTIVLVSEIGIPLNNPLASHIEIVNERDNESEQQLRNNCVEILQEELSKILQSRSSRSEIIGKTNE